MKKLWRFICPFLVGAILLAGCGGAGKSSDSRSPATEKKVIKVALLLPGPINDMSWNAAAYQALMRAKEKLGAEVAYTENVAASDMEEFFRGYASKGYDMVIGHGYQFGDAGRKVAKEFPKTWFVFTSANFEQPPNVASVNPVNTHHGFVAGALAAMLTKSKVVGAFQGMEIPPCQGIIEGFKQGVAYIDPKVKVLTAFTGNFDDVAKAKETALTMIAEGADIVSVGSNQLAIGGIHACREKGVLAIGMNVDQNSLAPDTVVNSIIQDVPFAIESLIAKMKDGTLEPKYYPMSFKEGGLRLSPWHGFESKVPQEVKDKLNEIIEGLGSGKINVPNWP